jgi:hypothetical protein
VGHRQAGRRLHARDDEDFVMTIRGAVAPALGIVALAPPAPAAAQDFRLVGTFDFD